MSVSASVAAAGDNGGSAQVILAIFAGRSHNLRVSRIYITALLDRGLIQSCHLWDFTRNRTDALYIQDWAAADRHGGRVQIKPVAHKHIWKEFYEHYRPEIYSNHIIIKADDDVVYYDLDGFRGFIDRYLQLQHQFLFAFPSIINNGVVAHYQQAHGYLPKSPLGEFPYQTLCGRLWGSGHLASQLHTYFLDHAQDFLHKAHSTSHQIQPHPMSDRLSINCFAVSTSRLHHLNSMRSRDDERELTMVIPGRAHAQHYIDMGFVVSHMAFYAQRSSGLQEHALLQRYAELYTLLYIGRTDGQVEGQCQSGGERLEGLEGTEGTDSDDEPDAATPQTDQAVSATEAATVEPTVPPSIDVIRFPHLSVRPAAPVESKPRVSGQRSQSHSRQRLKRASDLKSAWALLAYHPPSLRQGGSPGGVSFVARQRWPPNQVNRPHPRVAMPSAGPVRGRAPHARIPVATASRVTVARALGRPSRVRR